MRRPILIVALFAGLAACAADGEEQLVERSAEELFQDAQTLADGGNYRGAATAYEEVDRQHPYSQLATRAQMMAAYSYYESNQYDEAVTAAERFVELHPGNVDVPYAQYLIGMCYYEQISDVGRDQEMTQKSLQSFGDLIQRFPDSDYAKDAKLKVDLANDHLAGKQMEIGRYYQNRQQWIAAINRFRMVVEDYQTTTHVPEALHRLTESYLALGATQEAQAAAAVLGYNYPGSEWYERSYALLDGSDLAPESSSGSWLTSLF